MPVRLRHKNTHKQTFPCEKRKKTATWKNGDKVIVNIFSWSFNARPWKRNTSKTCKHVKVKLINKLKFKFNESLGAYVHICI
jgi:hypothetical protein